jgi:hypothetical protein
MLEGKKLSIHAFLSIHTGTIFKHTKNLSLLAAPDLEPDTVPNVRIRPKRSGSKHIQHRSNLQVPVYTGTRTGIAH